MSGKVEGVSRGLLEFSVWVEERCLLNLGVNLDESSSYILLSESRIGSAVGKMSVRAFDTFNKNTCDTEQS